MATFRRVTYESYDDQGRPCKAWYEGDARGWVDEGDALAFHGGNQIIRIYKRTIIGDVTYEKNSFCFISTAVYTNMGFNDDCPDLKTLTYYRDNYLLKTANGRKMVDNYYSIAPTIVCQIDKLENKNQIYTEIYEQYLIDILYSINQNEFESASQKYEKMVDGLFIKYNIEKIRINN